MIGTPVYYCPRAATARSRSRASSARRFHSKPYRELPILLLAVAGLGCSAEAGRAPSLPPEDRAAIEVLAAAYVQALSAEDPAAMAELYAEDAVQIPPDGPVAEGRAAIRAAMEAGPDAFFERLSYWGIRWSPDGYEDGLVYDWGSFGVAVAEDSTQNLLYGGKYLVLLRRQADGTWRIAREIWTSPRTSGDP